MCEYSPDCTKVTDPLAKALSENPREELAVVLVYCPIRYHTLAAVYDNPALGGLVLCTPHHKARFGSMFVVEPGDDPDEEVHFHPWLHPLADFEGEGIQGRCRCGTWWYRIADVRRVVNEAQAGTWEGVDPDAFVKVRNDATGKVSRMSREYVERHVLPHGGHTIVGRAPGSDRRRRPYVLGNYVQMADTPKGV